jgi:SNF2 family DNA or RNA helicase
VLLISIRAGGVGLNLQAASYVFHYDRWWNPAVEEQAESRAHRIGQTHALSVLRYIATDTVEERVAEVLESKRALFETVMDFDSEALVRHLSVDDLRHIFGCEGPRARARPNGAQPR